ncbi:MAG: hypothetical protein LBO81_00365 [Clostridiales Family XIII bacterium]|nr:hypothetical protein [Clostridiales Family XIII bacterium]
MVVAVPIIDHVLIEAELFELEFEPFWAFHWDSGDGRKQQAEDSEPSGGADKEGIAGGAYTTQRAGLAHRTRPSEAIGPVFTFDYPGNWTLEVTELSETTEQVTLTNGRGAEIIYYDTPENPGGLGRFMTRAEITKAADSRFVPVSAEVGAITAVLGKMMVAKVYTTGELFMDTDSDYHDTGGATSYAVLPESWLGKRDGLRGHYMVALSFDYAGLHSFTCTAPEGGFVGGEEQEVIQILSSFRGGQP